MIDKINRSLAPIELGTGRNELLKGKSEELHDGKGQAASGLHASSNEQLPALPLQEKTGALIGQFPLRNAASQDPGIALGSLVGYVQRQSLSTHLC